MALEHDLQQRSEGRCELCTSGDEVRMYEVPPQDQRTADNCIMLCAKCLAQIEKKAELDRQHWSCLTTAMWSEVPAVQVVSWRMLNRLRVDSWASEALEMMYLDDESMALARATGDHENDSGVILHRDCNGQILQSGDSVVLIRSLDVKGSTLKARMGTVVKNIRLVEDNTTQIEGRIEGQVIVILTKFVRKQG